MNNIRNFQYRCDRVAFILAVVILSIYLLTSPRANAADPMTRNDNARELIYTALLVIDAGQTRDIANHPGMYERNPLLGRSPSNDRITAYMAGGALLHYGVSAILPARARHVFQYVTLTVQGAVVANNFGIGLSVKF